MEPLCIPLLLFRRFIKSRGCIPSMSLSCRSNRSTGVRKRLGMVGIDRFLRCLGNLAPEAADVLVLRKGTGEPWMLRLLFLKIAYFLVNSVDTTED